ncbi:DUF5682 family protein [Streptomyces nitrosporeus]|uniref:DUF5682 family protein n=1 Tax=Streptomyces nitrosporeus TaxID=28894 RepID=UPI001988C7FB|nr:DUF5682 family protein [Streptomyces nitrosporeus]GGY75141.1 hypothetical protein GCM10010327_01110 [Streptomyces nitrosporeus]
MTADRGPGAGTAEGGVRKGGAVRGGAVGGGPGAPGGPYVLGVRHHGPGSARAVLAALDHVRPAAVLVEGPPEGDALVELAAHEGMRPPVALLVHAVDDPERAAFWPMSAFSPEWVAIRWALDRRVPVRFMDLPAAYGLAVPGQPEPGPGDARAMDPVGVLAATAGYDDAERWWEDVVEHRSADGAEDGVPASFAALAEAMGALREVYGDGGHPGDAVREAHMRLKVRAARKEFGDAVAVVCGAWHAPALTARTTIAADKALLKGIPKTRVRTTWVPWTNRRLARHSGYGAGIESPGWYGHLFGTRERTLEHWMTKAAGLLREEDHPVSPADVVEAVRLAGALAAVRGRPAAGLPEATDAIRAVMCGGSDVPLALVRDRLVVGQVLGEVPETAPAAPLQRDLAAQQRALRLRPEADRRDLELDLRKDTDAARSRLLHRLRLLGIGWGETVAGRGSTGTFRESWRLHWRPELFVEVAEAGVWGTTVLSAATARAGADAVSAATLAEVALLAERCLLAGLPDALGVVMGALADRAALDADVGHLADALPALARSLRYGDVRSTDTTALTEVAAGLAGRVCVGLPSACTGLGPDAAQEQCRRLDEVHTAVALLTGGGTRAPGPEEAGEGGTATGGRVRDGLRGRWRGVLRELAGREAVAGLVRGRAARLLLDDGGLTPDRVARLMGLALSPGTPPPDAAAWAEGFLGVAAGGGMLLVHDERLLALVDDWLTGMPAEAFTAVLPLLRRTFSAYEPGVRRTLGGLVRRGPHPGGAPGPAGATAPGFGPDLDEERADAVVPVLRLLLGPGTRADARTPAGTRTDARTPAGAGPAGPAARTGEAGGNTAGKSLREGEGGGNDGDRA